MASQFGALLRMLRRKVGMSQEQLAERSGMGIRTVRRLETGERADLRASTVRLLVDALDLSQEDRAALLAAAGTEPAARQSPLDEVADKLARSTDPAELLDAEAIEGKLAQAMIPPGYRGRRGLSYLAKHLHWSGKTGLAWWELASTVQRPVRALVIGVLSGLLIGLTSGLVNGFRFGLGVGLFAMVVLGLIQEALSARMTAGTLKASRTAAILRTSVIGVALAFGQGIFSGFNLGLLTWLAVAVAGGLGLTTWGRWLLFVRFWLPMTRRLPWKVLAFLDDACDRGLLRRVGQTYQFRYRLLQDHLAR